MTNDLNIRISFDATPHLRRIEQLQAEVERERERYMAAGVEVAELERLAALPSADEGK